MKIELTHPFRYRAHDLIGLFESVKTLPGFMVKLEQQSKLYPDNYSVEKYLGDGFEFFCEALIKTHQFDNRIGISNYQPVIENDNGVDGYGLNIHDEICAVQHKYKANIKGLLTSTNSNLDSFITEALLSKKIQPCEKFRHFVFTTGRGLHHYTDHEKYRGTVKCYGFKEISLLVDNNLHFWNFIKQEVRFFLENEVPLKTIK
jgi:hypothetical protein